MSSSANNSNSSWQDENNGDGNNPSSCMPIVFEEEVTVGSNLGGGGFCTVYSVRRIELCDDHEKQLSQNQRQCRIQLATRFKDMERHSPYTYPTIEQQLPAADPFRPPRLALKRLGTHLNPEKHATGLKDLQQEAHMLSMLRNQHSHIIHLYAIGYCTTAQKFNNRQIISFLLLDHLRSTLKSRLYQWRERTGLGIFLGSSDYNSTWLERMIILSKVASAIQFLHSKQILHRDLNPNNIGFDSDGTVNIFDFGLARTIDRTKLVPTVYAKEEEKPPNYKNGNSCGEDDNNTPYEAFLMTGNTGTLRYMAPEVALGHPYAMVSDVYSFALIIYEVLSLLTPFVSIKAVTTFHETVIKGGLRPSLDTSWPRELTSMLEKMWDEDPSNRPSSQKVMDRLEDLLRGPDQDLFPSSSRMRRFFGVFGQG